MLKYRECSFDFRFIDIYPLDLSLHYVHVTQTLNFDSRSQVSRITSTTTTKPFSPKQVGVG
jgi:hypothetical protein